MGGLRLLEIAVLVIAGLYMLPAATRLVVKLAMVVLLAVVWSIAFVAGVGIGIFEALHRPAPKPMTAAEARVFMAQQRLRRTLERFR